MQACHQIEAMANHFWNSGAPHRAEPVEVTPDLASGILLSLNYEHQRKHLPRHSAFLAEAISRGEFRKFHDIHFAVRSGIPRLINGQHTLHAISTAAQPLWLCVHMQRAETPEEVEDLYSKFDVGRKRSLSDALGTASDIPGLSKREADSLGVAVKRIRMGFSEDRSNAPMDAVFESRSYTAVKKLMKEWQPEAELYYDIVRTAHRVLFHRSPVVAVGLLTLRHVQAMAKDFWATAANDDGLRNGDPRKAMVNWLRSHSVGAAPFSQHRAVISCWNAFYEGRTLTKVKIKSEASLNIAGTDIRVGASFRDRGKLVRDFKE